MEINAQDVIDKLSSKLAKAEAEKAVLEVQVEALQEQNQMLEQQIPRDMPGETGNPVEGEVVGEPNL